MNDQAPDHRAHADPVLLCNVCTENEPRYPSLMCGGCFGRLRRDIATLVGAHTWLGIAMLNPGPAFRPGTRNPSGGGSRVPFRVQLLDARVDISGKLNSWARLIAEEHVPALAGPADGEPATVGRWLDARLRWVSDQPWCDEMAHEFADTARGAYALVPWNRHRRDLPLPCPDCGYLTLTLYGGTELILCRWSDCARTLTWGEYWTEVRKQQDISQPESKPTTSDGAAA